MKRVTKPGFKKLERWTRLKTAQAFEGHEVVVTRKTYGDEEIVRGTVLSAARTIGGASADVLVIACDDWDGRAFPEPESFAISLATIVRIEDAHDPSDVLKAAERRAQLIARVTGKGGAPDGE